MKPNSLKAWRALASSVRPKIATDSQSRRLRLVGQISHATRGRDLAMDEYDDEARKINLIEQICKFIGEHLSPEDISVLASALRNGLAMDSSNKPSPALPDNDRLRGNSSVRVFPDQNRLVR